MKIKRLVVVLVVLVTLVVCSCATAQMDPTVESMLGGSLVRFYDNAIRHPVYISTYVLTESQAEEVSAGKEPDYSKYTKTDEWESNFVVYFEDQNPSGKMLNTFALGTVDWKAEWEWDFIEAMYRALECVDSVANFDVNDEDNSVAYAFEAYRNQNQEPRIARYMMPLSEAGSLPCDKNSHKKLLDGNGGRLMIAGLNTAYMTGGNEQYKSEMYPFYIGNFTDEGYESAAYIYFRTVIPLDMFGGDPNGEQIDEYVLADQSEVAAVFAQILDTTSDLSSADREWMENFIQNAQ